MKDIRAQLEKWNRKYAEVILVLQPQELYLSQINDQGNQLCDWIANKLIKEMKLPISRIYVNTNLSPSEI